METVIVNTNSRDIAFVPAPMLGIGTPTARIDAEGKVFNQWNIQECRVDPITAANKLQIDSFADSIRDLPTIASTALRAGVSGGINFDNFSFQAPNNYLVNFCRDEGLNPRRW